MEKDNADWSIGDTCVLVVSIPKRYTQEFEVKGFDGKYYTLKHGNSIQHAAPVRMFRTKEEALTALDTGNYPANGEDSFRRLTEEELAEEQQANIDEDNAPVMGM